MIRLSGIITYSIFTRAQSTEECSDDGGGGTGGGGGGATYSSFAQKMMSKMGHKSGQGLGSRYVHSTTYLSCHF